MKEIKTIELSDTLFSKLAEKKKINRRLRAAGLSVLGGPLGGLAAEEGRGWRTAGGSMLGSAAGGMVGGTMGLLTSGKVGRRGHPKALTPIMQSLRRMVIGGTLGARAGSGVGAYVAHGAPAVVKKTKKKIKHSK